MQPIAFELDEVASRLRAYGESVEAFDDDALLRFAAAFERVARAVGAVQTRVAGEVGARSRSELGDEGLSRSQNFATPAKLLGAVTGVAVREAQGRLELGGRMRGAPLLGGDAAPEPFPRVRAAMMGGEVSVACAAIITRECAALLARGSDPGVVSDAEKQLVAAACNPLLTTDDVARLAVRVRENLDPDGLEPRAEALHEARSFTLARGSDGMYRGRLALPPEDGALWLGALQAMISPRTGPRFVAHDGAAGDDAACDGETVSRAITSEGHAASEDSVASEDELVARMITADTRTVPQKMADAATELIARAAGATDMPHLAGATTTVNIHVNLADLEQGRGPGWIDGIDDPVPMSTIERLRCHSPEAVTVFGRHGEVLQHGKIRRLFTPAQIRALAARDGGCVWPGCDRPPSACEAHHVVEWKSGTHPPGRTDIENGALLCRFHHARIHKPAWTLIMLHGSPHIVPPRWIDTSQTPIRTTRRRTLAPDPRGPSGGRSWPETERRSL